MSVSYRSAPNLRIVGEASDGPEALRKVEELAPELILLDVGLPTMDGITVASAIAQAAPEAKILMLSAHNGGAIVHAALLAGARGYLLKSHAGKELLPAIEAVVRGELFVSSRIAPDDASCRHAVQFYSNDETLSASLCDLVASALERMHPVIVIATKTHLDKLSEQLRARAIEIGSYESTGHYISLDAAEALSGFMIGNLPNAPAFFSQMGDVIHRAEAASGSAAGEVVIFGEIVELLWAEGKREAAFQLERLWNELARSFTFRLRCAYPSNIFHSASEPSFQTAICAQHSTVLGS